MTELIVSGEWDVFSGVKLHITINEDGTAAVTQEEADLRCDGQELVDGALVERDPVVVAAGGAPHIRIFASIFGSGLIVTTINTVVLRYFTLPAWAGRAFWILWTPRALEELIICLIQAYFIAILYDVYMTRFQDRL